MSEEATTLNWGDIIRIHGVNLSKSNDDKTKGLIVSKGYDSLHIDSQTRTFTTRSTTSSTESTCTDNRCSKSYPEAILTCMTKWCSRI